MILQLKMLKQLANLFDEALLLRYNNHICYVKDINKFFKKFRCPSCDVFFNHSGHFNRHLRTCKERAKNIYPRGVYSLKETFFQKLENFSIAYPEDCTLFKILPSSTMKQYVTTHRKLVALLQHHGLELM